ncbi:MAG TPA: cytochrome c biogenesis protein CcdA, partial [Fimbriimonadaceae bacterium]|nr:cytochrome c biogenesis protein CcdA [Fimbriimonadaceae bacterium]
AGSVQVTEPQPEATTTTTTAAQTSPPAETGATPASGGSAGGLLGFLNNALSSGNWLLIIPAALLAGLALCLTPCVFPMIPVTVSFFSNQGSKTTGGRFSLGFFYMLGIAVTYGAVGGISAAAGGAVGELFTKQWFVLALAALLIALALSMFDLYEIRLPGFIQKNLKGRSGPVGALIMGLLMGFAAAPCAGALVGAVAVKVAEIGSVPTGLGFFGAIGVGMGLPFMVLATVSSGAKALPRSGGWLKTTKAVLGLLVLYIAADYLFQGIGLKPGEASTQIAWILVFAAFLIYLLFLDKSDSTKAVSRIKGVTAVALGVLAGMAYSNFQKIRFDEEYARLLKQQGGAVADSQVSGDNINWILYNDQNFAKAVASGKPILIDGRADWCKICHELEDRVFKTPEGLIALSNVYLLEIDWSTNVPDAYKDMTKKRFNITGLPHVVFMKPGGKDEFSVGDIKDVAELKSYLRRAGAKI